MVTTEVVSALASFATLKCLSDTQKYSNTRQVLGEFITYIVCTQKLYSFSSVEMKNKLKDVFEFDIPESVVKSASKALPYVSREKGLFHVDNSTLSISSTFQETKESAQNAHSNIINALSLYISERNPDEKIAISREHLTKDLIAFLVDSQDRGSGRYFEYISEFIIKHESDVEMQRMLNDIREGSILFIGLNYNINETGSLRRKLTLFLGTEVLFSLAGYNGEVYHKLAMDFYTQVKNANLNGEKVSLRIFPETRLEINAFFSTAKSIVAGKTSIVDTTAMQAIVNGCETISDVTVKESDFNHLMQFSYGIIDDETDYYANENHCYNLESIDITDEQMRIAWRFVSHINIQRKGEIATSDIDAGFLFVTNTGNTLRISKEYSESIKNNNSLEYISNYAVSVDRITNILWYKLGNGFGQKNYPQNADVVIKARTVLSACISKNIATEFSKAKEQYHTGEITTEQLAARIIAFRGKPTLPESLEGDCIEDIMDFSPEYISRFEEEINTNRSALAEKELEIKRITEQSEQVLIAKDKEIAEKDQLIQETHTANITLIAEKDNEITRITEQSEKQLSEKDREIEARNIVIQNTQDENESLKMELGRYQEQERIKTEKKVRRRKVLLFIWAVIWKMVAVILVFKILSVIISKYGSEVLNTVIAEGDIIMYVLAFCGVVKKDFRKQFPKKG